MKYLIVLLFLFIQDPVAFKPSDEFQIKPELTFKQRSTSDDSEIHMSETRKENERRKSTDALPYLKLNVKIQKVQAGEYKVRIIRDNQETLFSKKVSPEMELKFEPGFTDDIKDGISGFKHEIEFVSADKKVVSRILIEIDKEGNYMVNGEKRGKF